MLDDPEPTSGFPGRWVPTFGSAPRSHRTHERLSRHDGRPVLPSDPAALEEIDRLLPPVLRALRRQARSEEHEAPATLDEAIALWVGCPAHNLRCYRTTLPDSAEVAYAAQRLIQSAPEGWKTYPLKPQTFDPKHLEAVTYSEVQVGLQERAFCITDGYVFVDAPEGRWVLFVGDRSLYADERTFGIYLPEGSERRVDAILERFNALRVQESRFRGRCVTIGEKDVRYLDVDPVDWDDVVLEEHVLDQIRRNVFLPLEDSERWLASGLPRAANVRALP